MGKVLSNLNFGQKYEGMGDLLTINLIICE